MRLTALFLVLCFSCTSSNGVDAGGDTDGGGFDASSAVDGATPDVSASLDSGAGVDAGAADSGAGDVGTDASGPAECSADAPCEGACTGRSCSATWYCVSDTPCTDDIATFCGCDGTTFAGSSTCPPRPFASRGACPGRATSCDPRGISCRIPTPECEPGFVPEVNESGSCWTMRCVPIDDCACSSPEECPGLDQYTCRNDTGRCSPFL